MHMGGGKGIEEGKRFVKIPCIRGIDVVKYSHCVIACVKDV